MKTNANQLRALKLCLAELPSSGDYIVPVGFLAALVDDVEDCFAAHEAMDRLAKRLDALEAVAPAKPRLVLVAGGDEDVPSLDVGGEGGGGDAA